MDAMKVLAQEPADGQRPQADVKREGNVISVDFGREVRERQQRSDAENRKRRRDNLIDVAILILVVAGLVSLMLNVILRVFS